MGWSVACDCSISLPYSLTFQDGGSVVVSSLFIIAFIVCEVPLFIYSTLCSFSFEIVIRRKRELAALLLLQSC